MSKAVKNILLFTWILLSLSLYYPSPDLAGETDDGIYTLEKCVRYAIENNLQIKIKEQQVAEAQYGRKKARADMLPRFSTSYTYRREGEVSEIKTPAFSFTMGTKDNYQWQAAVTQPVFTGFALSSANELARLGIDLSEVELKLEKLDIALQAKQAYFSILKADKAVLVAQAAVESLKEHLKAAKNFYDAGMTPVNDLLKAEVELANSEQNLIKARNSAMLARASFNTVLSNPVNSPVTVEDIEDFSPEQTDFEKICRQALIKRPEIKSIEINDLQVDQQIRLAKSKYYPEVAVTYNYIKAGDSPGVSGSYYHDSSTWNALATVSWNFWNWGGDHYNVRQKELNKAQLANTKKYLEDGIKLEIKNAVLNLEETEKRIPSAKKAVEQGEENLRVSSERYRAQVTTSTEVLDAQTLLTRAKVNYYEALYDHHLAKAALLRALGEY